MTKREINNLVKLREEIIDLFSKCLMGEKTHHKFQNIIFKLSLYINRANLRAKQRKIRI